MAIITGSEGSQTKTTSPAGFLIKHTLEDTKSTLIRIGEGDLVDPNSLYEIISHTNGQI